jgi:MFS family permease
MQDNRKALAVLFISLFLVMVGFGIIMPILPFYVRYYQGNAATLGRIVGPVIGGAIYELHMDYTFALGAGLLFATTLMVRPRLRRYAPAELSLKSRCRYE